MLKYSTLVNPRVYFFYSTPIVSSLMCFVLFVLYMSNSLFMSFVNATEVINE